jgi:hypothetical protein
MKKLILSNEKGFALLAALMACLILLAIGILVINMSTGDLFTSSATVGIKKAQLAVESGAPKLLNDVRPENWTFGLGGNHYSQNPFIEPLTNIHYTCGTDAYDQYDRTHTPSLYEWQAVPGGSDANTVFAVCVPVQSLLPPIPKPGGELGGGGGSHDNPQAYVYRYDSTVLGKNTTYNSQSKIDIGVGFGPM